MYDATLGRFLQRDPTGFAAGDVDLYEYASDNPSLYVDPSGLDCCCKKDPEDCYLKYSTSWLTIAIGKTTNKGKGYEQEFHKKYKVALVSKSGKDTCGCHILQSAYIYEVYSNPADAKPNTPGHFNKPANEPGFFSFVVPFFPSRVVSGAPADIKPESTDCDERNKQARIYDRPGFRSVDPDAQADRLDSYGFFAYDYVEEAPSVHGSILMTATYNWPKGGGSYTILSSDKGIDKKGNF